MSCVAMLPLFAHADGPCRHLARVAAATAVASGSHDYPGVRPRGPERSIGADFDRRPTMS